jgi:Mrp family chromosome partitioning ATPase
MFSARAIALAGVPAVAAGLALTAAGTAQAAPVSAPVAEIVPATSKAEPITGEPVLIKASKRKGENRIVTVRGDGSVDLSRKKPTASNGLSADGTWMVLKNVGSKKNPMYRIMSLNDSEEANSYCLQQKKSGALDLTICKKAKANQRFDFAHSGDKFSIEGKWGYLKADKRELRLTDEDKEAMSFFSVVAKN